MTAFTAHRTSRRAGQLQVNSTALRWLLNTDTDGDSDDVATASAGRLFHAENISSDVEADRESTLATR